MGLSNSDNNGGNKIGNGDCKVNDNGFKLQA
jgi:hypothetical protein